MACYHNPDREGQTLFLAENSEIPIFAISWAWEGKKEKKKRSMHWLGQGFEIGLNEKLGRFKETWKNVVSVISKLILWLQTSNYVNLDTLLKGV